MQVRADDGSDLARLGCAGELDAEIQERESHEDPRLLSTQEC